MRFIDEAVIEISSGDGGNGCLSFRREKFIPKGGPDGGDGGKGGNINFIANESLHTLQDFKLKRKYKAQNGRQGKGKNMHGKNGQDVVIEVPVGTIVKNFSTKQVIHDFTVVEKIQILKGGNGGFGNARFKTKKNTAPRNANDGQAGNEMHLDLELKVLADIGLVGFPNAGKSTFISKISNAKPKIADYPFTTLIPNLGIVKYHDYKSFVMADIPGIIEGASKGKGLGNQFLKHIERTKALVYFLDGSEDICEQLKKLKAEIMKYSDTIKKKPSIVFINKIDVVYDIKKLLQDVKELSPVCISALTGENVDSSINQLVNLIKESN